MKQIKCYYQELQIVQIELSNGSTLRVWQNPWGNCRCQISDKGKVVSQFEWEDSELEITKIIIKSNNEVEQHIHKAEKVKKDK